MMWLCVCMYNELIYRVIILKFNYQQCIILGCSLCVIHLRGGILLYAANGNVVTYGNVSWLSKLCLIIIKRLINSSCFLAESSCIDINWSSGTLYFSVYMRYRIPVGKHLLAVMLPYKMKYWQGVNLGNWQFLDETLTFNPPIVIYMCHFYYVFYIINSYIVKMLFYVFHQVKLSPIFHLMWCIDIAYKFNKGKTQTWIMM